MYKINKNIPFGIIKNNNIVATAGKGCWIWDKYNTKFLDMTSGIGALSTGHCHPRIKERVHKQVDTLVHAQQNCFYSHTEQEILINKLTNILPKRHDNIFFTNSGTESTENAIKIARMATKKPNIIAMNGGFHGRSLGALSLTSSKISYRKGFQPMIPGVFFCNEFTKECFNNILEKQTSPDETCAVILEPILGEGGIYEIPFYFVEYVRKVCNHHNIMLIFDEVQCGSGRTGKWWASEYWGISPDLMTFAKGIGSGFPIGAVSGRSDIFNKMSKNSLGGTYNGNAISTAACNATIETIEDEKLLDNAIVMGKKIKDGLVNIDCIDNVRQYGLFIAADINPKINVNDIINECVKENILLLTCGENALRIIPPLIISEYEVNYFLKKFKKVVSYFD